ncbi:MAG: HAD-IIB family hydrolase [bacterium]|nr:HAD-IIB family hydrolase [bacterium]
MSTNDDLNSDILNDAYNLSLELKPYSFFDIAQRLQIFASSAVSVEKDIFSKYLLFLRRDYLIQEVCAKPQSDYAKALIGIFSISPFIVKEIVLTKGVNIFLARDAARDFVTARIMDTLGLKKNRSYILYFARKNLKNVYSATTKLISEVRTSHLDDQELYRKMSEEFIVNTPFRDEATNAYSLLEKCGLLNYEEIRFIDTWASGSIFYALHFIIKLFDEYKYEKGKLVKKKTPLVHKVSFATANNKERVMVVETSYDYLNVESEFNSWWKLPKAFYNHYKYEQKLLFPIRSFNCNSVNIQQIQAWYRYYGIPFLYNKIQPRDFCDLLTAQIYKGLNHFGSLNFGHPVEWDDEKKQIIASSSAKKIGNLMRNMFLINAVIGYQNNYTKPIKQRDFQKVIKGSRVSLLIKKFGLNRYKASMLDRVLYDNNEHVVTCHSSMIENLVQNIIITMDFFGYRAIAEMSYAENYNFQYYLNGIKFIPAHKYKESLNILNLVYTKKMVKKMLFQSTYHFVKEILKANQMKINLHRKIEMIVFDIDGTLTPISEGVDLIVRCIERNMKIAFITGRTRSFCMQMADDLNKKIPFQLKTTAANILFYCSNGSEAFYAEGTVYKKRKNIPINIKRKLYNLFNTMDLIISSERDYRIIATYKGKDNNANRLLAYIEKIKEEVKGARLGVYLIKWNMENSDKTLPFNSIDICSSSKKEALAHLLQNGKSKNYIVIGDDPENSDREIIGENDISVEGYGILKTRAIINYILANRKVKTH